MNGDLGRPSTPVNQVVSAGEQNGSIVISFDLGDNHYDRFFILLYSFNRMCKKFGIFAGKHAKKQPSQIFFY